MSEQVAIDSRYRILIVDDDDDVRDALLDELNHDYAVTAVATGIEALKHLDAAHYDAIISDQRMPGMSGIEVLDAAQEQNPELIRILLTGFSDADAHTATMQENAPYKVGKPWHDDVEVTLKRAFEHREREHSLSAAVSDALALSDVDGEIAAAESPRGLAKILVRRIEALNGVHSCAVEYRENSEARRLDEDRPSTRSPAGEWRIDLPIDHGSSMRLIVHGTGSIAYDIVDYLAMRARHWSSQDTATRLAKKASDSPQAREKLIAVTRRATLGTMTAALVHELASMVQGLQGALFEIEDFVRAKADQEEDEEVIETLEHATETSDQMIALFRAMRTFVRSGDSAHHPYKVGKLVDRAVALCRGSLSSIVTLDIAPFPQAEVDVNEALFLQILVNLLTNAAEASPLGSTVHVVVTVENNEALFTVSDKGCGVPEDLANEIFEPYVSTKNDHAAVGLGLAICQQIANEHGGQIRYQPRQGGGSEFIVAMPLAAESAGLSLVS